LDTPADEVTSLLLAWKAGDRTVEQRLFELVWPDLHRLAAHLMGAEPPENSLQATALINEVYCRLVRAPERDWQNRQHFFAVAARAMRYLLIDRARDRRRAHKAPVDQLDECLQAQESKLDLALAVDGLLRELEATEPDWCSIIELKFFLGFTDEETASTLGMPLRTMQRKFGDARRWLYLKLEPQPCRR
jgi:RNA polymerase sigma factor (TIGR02999 family)